VIIREWRGRAAKSNPEASPLPPPRPEFSHESGPWRADRAGGRFSCASLATRKSRQGFPRRLARCVLRGGVLRRAVLERGASSYLDAPPAGWSVANVSGQRSPMLVKGDALQASGAVLSKVNLLLGEVYQPLTKSPIRKSPSPPDPRCRETET
jgi:hypothetical protein